MLPKLAPSQLDKFFPLKLTTEFVDGSEFGTLKVETAVGRASWLWSIQRILNTTASILHQHHWTILRPAQGMNWFTTDKPVIRLNFYRPGSYDFRVRFENHG